MAVEDRAVVRDRSRSRRRTIPVHPDAEVDRCLSVDHRRLRPLTASNRRNVTR